MITVFSLKSSVSAPVHRSVIRKRPQLGEGLVMRSCAAAAFVFVGLFVLGVF